MPQTCAAPHGETAVVTEARVIEERPAYEQPTTDDLELLLSSLPPRVRQSLDTPLQLRRALSENRIVALLMDRHLGRDRVAVRLLGREAWFLKTPVLMAYLTGAPLVTCFIDRVGPGRFRARPGRAITVSRDVPRDQAIQDAAQQLATDLEERIRQRPECWYQFYRYWEA